MKVIVNRAEFLALCKCAARLANDSSPIEELRGVLLEADADTGQLSVSATNMEVSLRSQMKADVRDGGSLVLNAKMAVGMIGQLPGEQIGLYSQANTLLLAGGHAKYAVSVLPGRRYPPIDLPFPADTVQVSGVPAMSRRTVFAASSDQSRAVMQCVNLTFSDDGLKAVSSDGFRVMSAKGELKGGGAISMLIPARSLALLAGMCSDEDVFHVGTTGKSIVYMKEGFIFSARTMEGTYINTDSLFDSCQPLFTVLTDGEELYKAMDSVTTLGGSGCVAALKFESGGIEVSCNSDTGTARTTLEVIPLVGTPSGTYHYTADKLRECLRAMGGTMQLKVAQNGVLLMGTEQVSCLNMARRAPVESKPKQEKTKPKAA